MSEALKIKVNAAALTIDDLEILDGSGEGVGGKDILDVLDRCIEGGVRGRGLPMSALFEIGQHVRDALAQTANPKNSAGG